MAMVTPSIFDEGGMGGSGTEWNPADGGGSGSSSGGGSSGGGGGGSSEPVDPNNAMYRLVLDYHGHNYSAPYVVLSAEIPNTVDTVYAPVQDGVVNTAMLADCPTSITATDNSNGSRTAYLGYYRVVEEGYQISDYDHVDVYYAGATVTKTWHGGRNGTTNIACWTVWATSGIIIYHPGTLSSYQRYRSKFKTAGTALTLPDGWFTRDGYIQNGWTKTDGGAKQYDFGDSYTPSDGAVEFMYPSWEEYTPPGTNFTITIHPNGATGEDIVLTVEAGAEVVIPDDNTYSRNGYHLSVWNESPDGDGSSWIPGETYIFERGADVELYAIWAGDEYTVRYANNAPSINLFDPDNLEQLTLSENNGQSTIQRFGHKYSIPGTYAINAYGSYGYSVIKFVIKNSDDSWYSAYNIVNNQTIKSYIVPITEGQELYVYNSQNSNTINSSLLFNAWKIQVALSDTQLDEYHSYVPTTYSYSSKAVFGEPFYTDRVPYPDGKEYCTFDGWVADDDTVLTKADAWFEAYSYGADPTWTLQRDLVIYPRWTPYWSSGKVFFGGMYSDDCSIRVEEPPSYIWPEYSYAHDKVYGKSGDILRDNGRYENVSKKYKISAYDGTNFFNVSRKVSEWLHRKGSNMYMRLEDSYEPDIYMMAVYEESNELDNLLATAGKCEITFNCMPQKFLLSGDVPIDITQSGQVITNPTSNPAFPIITFSGSGNIMINGKAINVIDNFNVTNFHTDSFNAFDIAGRNMNGYIYALDSLILNPGENVIEYDGYISDLKITPRWWRV